MQAKSNPGRLLVVSNRLPVTLRRAEQGDWSAEPSSGGLVSAMLPVLHQRGGTWIGWPGVTDADAGEFREVLDSASRESGVQYEPVQLSAEEQEGFYYGFSNEIIWPLFHDLVTNCNFNAEYWDIYERVNRKFAKVLEQVCEPDDLVWVHDYHLMQVASHLHRESPHARTGFFLHIPFPSPDMFMKLPWRAEILRSLLAYDTLGFQTIRDRRHFLQCMRMVYDISTHGTGSVLNLRVYNSYPGQSGGENASTVREMHVGSFPIGIDSERISKAARSESVRMQAHWLRKNLRGRTMILGVDRLDYTKGLLQKVHAFAAALRAFPDMHGQATLVQHVVPSRVDIPEYHKLRMELEQTISAINGEFTEAGWVPIHYMYHSLDQDTLIAYYQSAEIALITPLKDGMNLVAKEYCAAHVDEDGIVILSEFAGSAAQMQNGAMMVNPYDAQCIAEALHDAFLMSAAERQDRMRRLRRSIRSHNVFHWADTFLATLTDRNVSHFQSAGEYAPGER